MGTIRFRKKAGWAAVIAFWACTFPTLADSLIGSSQLQAVGLTSYWEAHLPLPPHDVVKEGYLVDEALYVITDMGTLFSLQADVGLVRWAEKLTAPEFTIHKPTHLLTAAQDGPAVILTSEGLFVLDRFTGERKHTLTPDFAVASLPVGFNNMIFVGGSNGRFYSLRLPDGPQTGLLKRWEVVVDGAVTATPLLYGAGKLLFATRGGTIYSCDALDKTLDWRFRIDGPILGDPAVNDSGVYVAGSDRSLYKFDGNTGRLLWRRRFPCELIEGPVVTTHTVYQYCEAQGLSAVDADSGEEEWRIPDGRVFAARLQGQDAIFTKNRHLLFVNQDSGEVTADIHAFGVVDVVTNPQDDSLYLLGRDGRVLCARPTNARYLRKQEMATAKDRLNLPPREDLGAVEAVLQRGAEERDESGDDPFRSRRDVRP